MTAEKNYKELIKLIENNEVRKISFLLSNKNYDVNYVSENGPSYLSKAIFIGNLDVVSLLFEKGANPLLEEKDGLTPLHNLALSGSIEIFDLFIKYAPNCFNEDFDISPVYLSAMKKHTTLTKMLAKTGMNIDEHLNSLLYLSALRGEVDNVDFYIMIGADVNYIKDGVSVLTAAITNGNEKIIKLLENKGAFGFDEHQKNVYDDIEWFTIIFQNDPDLVRHYIAKGCDKNLKNNDGKTALDIAREYDLDKLINILKN